jgi:hypothetical protein
LSKPKFASVTAQLIVRKGEASPSVIASNVVAVPAPHPVAIESVNANAHLPSPLIERNGIKPWGVTVTLPPTDPETLGYVVVKKNVSQEALSRLVEEGSGNIIIVPVEIDTNLDCSVTVSLLESSESFTHDGSAGGWVGSEGSFLTGSADLFRDASGWCVTITMHESRPPLFEIRQGARCELLKLDGFPLAAMS